MQVCAGMGMGEVQGVSGLLKCLTCCLLAVQAAGPTEQQGLPVTWRRTTVNALVQVCASCS